MENNTNKKLKILYRINKSQLQMYEQNSVYFSKPRLVAYYEHNYDAITDGKRINYFKKPQLTHYPFDLNDGFQTHQFRKSSMYSKGIELSLKYAISPLAEQFDHDDSIDNVERTMVYTRRGTLSHIMQTNYVKKNNDWSVKVSRYDGNLYILKEEYDESELSVKKVHTHHHRLEKILFAASPDESPNIDEPCDENNNLIGVHRSILGKYDIVYSGEVQGIIADENFEEFDSMEELDKCRFVLTKQLWKKLENSDQKFLNYWLQAYLANVKDLYVAYKNLAGVVETPIEHINVSQIPQNRYWKPNICNAILYDFIKRVENLMSEINCLNTVYVFHYNPSENLINYEIFNGESDKTFITEEYMDYCKDKTI